MNYSLDNHYKWGFGKEWFNLPEDARDYFKVSIGSCKQPPKSLRQECVTAADKLATGMTKPIVVGLSGGFDSQVVCISLMEAGVSFNPVILRLHNGKGTYYNRTDYENAMFFCRLHRLEPIIEELNLDEFYCGEGMQLIQDNCITVAEIAVQLYLVKKYKDTHAYINGGGDPTLSFMDNDTGGDLVYSLGPTPIQQHMVNNSIEGCLKFFMYSPEQIAAYLTHPVIVNYERARATLHDGHRGPSLFTFVVKPTMYLEQWPELVQRRKQTGFEQVPYFSKVRELTQRLNAHINPYAKKITWTWAEITDHLLEGSGDIKTWRSIDEKSTQRIYPCAF